MEINKTLLLYKNLLKQCKYIIEQDKKLSFINRIKLEYRENKNAENVEELLKKGENHLSFLKTITPKSPKSSQGNKKFIMRNGKLEEIETFEKQNKAISNFREGNVDPDQLKRHQQLLDRQHFKSGPLQGYPKKVWK